MTFFERDFNPYEYDEFDDAGDFFNDEGDEIVIARHPMPIVIGINQLDNAEFSTKLDGIQIISNKPSIAKICKVSFNRECVDFIRVPLNCFSLKLVGIASIQRFPTIFPKNLGAFKGHENYIGRNTRHVYEMTLFSIGTMRLSALITTEVSLQRIRRMKYSNFFEEYNIKRIFTIILRIRVGPPYGKFIATYHEAIRRCIRQLPITSKTRKEVMFRLDGVSGVIFK